MRKKCIAMLVPAVFVAALVVSTSAYAKPTIITLSGTHSRGQVKKDCDAVGGTYSDTHSYGYGYGCLANNGNIVNCKNNGKCTGSIPRQSKPSHTLGGILHSPSGVKTTGGVKGRHLGHRRVVKTSGLKTKAMYRRSSGPTNPNGPDIPGKNKGPFTTPEHHSGRHR